MTVHRGSTLSGRFNRWNTGATTQPLTPDSAPAATKSPVGWLNATQKAPNTPAAAQAKKDHDKLKEMKALLKSSATGVAAVKDLEAQKLPVTFANGGGSYWNGAQIVIDRGRSTDEAALSLVHELVHARAHLSGTSGQLRKQARADYVNTLLSEEVRGTVDAIRAKNELAASGKNVTGTRALENAYNAAYKLAVDRARKANPQATAAELTTAGEQAGNDRVMKGFLDGEVVTSTTGQTYSEYYGKAWDQARSSP